MMLKKYLILLTTFLMGTANINADSLWTLDDNRIVYNITKAGTYLNQFRTSVFAGTDIFVSGMDVDRGQHFLWVVSEYDGVIYKITKSGSLRYSFTRDKFDSAATEIEGIAVDNHNYTLWVVDDVTQKVYNLTREGELIGSFLLSDITGNTGPQDIAIDVSTNSLWVIDNESKALYNFTKGNYLNVDPVTKQITGVELIKTITLSNLNPAPVRPQSVTVDEKNNTLWLVGYDPDYVYHIDKQGKQLHSFPSINYTPGTPSVNPVGIAYDDY